MTQRRRAIVYAVILVSLNVYFVQNLFLVDFTHNMQTNAGTFMAISRFIVEHWPRLDWFPWWFDGEPFENSYTPALQFVDAAVAAATGCSTARAFNFVTALFFVAGPAFLLLLAWRVSGRLETSFGAALLYSLFSPCALFKTFRDDLTGIGNPWRERVLVHYGEGPHTVALSLLPVALLLIYLALTRRKLLWFIAGAAAMALVTLVNAFGAADLAIGCACLAAAFRSRREVLRAAAWMAAMAAAAYLWVCPFLTPTVIREVSHNTQYVGGYFIHTRMLPFQIAVLAGFAALWLALFRLKDYFTRFSVLFAYVFCAITALYDVAHRAALPQPHRYSLEMDPAVALAVAFALSPLAARMRPAMKIACAALLVALAIHQTIAFRRYARWETRTLDVTKTVEYKLAQWIGAHLGSRRVLISSQASTWMNVFIDTPQADGGHGPFHPNWEAEESALYAIYSGEGAGAQNAANSILWLKAYGCHAVHVSGPKSGFEDKPFRSPAKFDGVLPLLWREEGESVYEIPQRTDSPAHVVPLNAIVHRQPFNGLDTADTRRYVAALDDPAYPEAPIQWFRPGEGRIRTTLLAGQAISVQSTYDPGWIASANGKPAPVERDGLGLTVIHPSCNGPCEVEFRFDGGTERKVCRLAGWTMTLLAVAGLALGLHRQKKDLYSTPTAD